MNEPTIKRIVYLDKYGMMTPRLKRILARIKAKKALR
jgi:hypothetical protein